MSTGREPRPLAVTGGMGSGKSRVAAALGHALDWLFIDADQVARQVVAPDEPGWQGLLSLLGTDYFLEDRTLDRAKLRKSLFDEADLRSKVNELLHPIIHRAVMEQCRSATDEGRGALVEVPLLYEAGWQEFFAPVVVVYASRAICLQRLVERDSMTVGEAGNALGAQMDLEEKVLLAQHVIDNNGPWHETLLQIHHLARLFLS